MAAKCNHGPTRDSKRVASIRPRARPWPGIPLPTRSALVLLLVAAAVCLPAAASSSTTASHVSSRESTASSSPGPTPGPTTRALRNAQVVTQSKATLTYRVDDVVAPTATVTLVLTTSAGRVVARLADPAPVKTNTVVSWGFRCTLRAGAYRYHIEAVDSLGKAQVSASSAQLRVLPIFPTARCIDAATRWLERRHSSAGFVVIDDRGVLRGHHVNAQFASASVVKAMLLVRYLRTHATLSSTEHRRLARMIIVSDNVAASAIYGVVGDSGLRACARLVHMTHFAVHGNWALARITAADQARLFYSMDSFVPKGYRLWVRYLFSHITPAHCWGIPEIARPLGWVVYFKGGYMPVSSGIVVHEVSRLEGTGKQHGGIVFALAILTSGQESLGYGAATLRGVTARVLGTSTKLAVIGMVPNPATAP